MSDENAKHGDRGDDVAAGDDADRIVDGDHFAVDMTLPVPGDRRPDHFGGIEIPDAPNDEEGDGDRDEVLIKVTLLFNEQREATREDKHPQIGNCKKRPERNPFRHRDRIVDQVLTMIDHEVDRHQRATDRPEENDTKEELHKSDSITHAYFSTR